MSTVSAEGGTDAVAAMDRMYRYTRHVYDASRKFYLLGRDQLISSIQMQPGERALEIGCGTGRNLLKLHRRFPQNPLYGLDASTLMLDTARKSIASCSADQAITLAHCLGQEVDYRKTFGLDRPFDVVFCSYCLSMIPPWDQVLAAALQNLRPGGQLWIVDFWDQAGLPSWFALVLKRWLAMFHVHYRPEVHDRLMEVAATGQVKMQMTSIYGRYAYLACLSKQA